MNKSLPIVLLLAVLGLGAGLAYQSQQAASLRERLTQLQRELDAARELSAREAAASLRLQEKVESYQAATAQLESRNKELAAGAPAPAGEAAEEAGEKKERGGFAGMMKKMFTDPEMKKVMRAQQAMSVRMMYGDLAQELALAPGDAKLVMDLLADRQAAMTEKGMKLLESGEDSAGGEEAANQAAESEKGFDAQIEAILGKDGVAKMEEYERTMGDRMQMQQYRQAFSSNGTPLDEQQANGLLNIMKEERLREPPSPFDAGSKDVGAAMKAMQSDDTINRLIVSQEDMAQRVLTRARSVLSPDQMTQFETIQKQQIEMQKMGLQMSKQFMGGKSANPPPTPKRVEPE